MAKATIIISTVPMETEAFLKSESGTSGCAALPCHQTKTAVSTAKTARKPMVLLSPQPHSGALMIDQTSVNITPDRSATPGQSILASSSVLLSLMIHRPMPSATMPTGTLMKKTDCQLTFSTSTPPMIGPAALERPMMAPQAPIATL